MNSFTDIMLLLICIAVWAQWLNAIPKEDQKQTIRSIVVCGAFAFNIILLGWLGLFTGFVVAFAYFWFFDKD